MKEVLDFLTNNRPFYLSTIKGDQAKVRPMGFIMEFENKIYFGAGTHKEVYQQMRANPKVEISTTNPDGNWLRLTGRVVFDDRPEVLQAAFSAMPTLKDIYPAGGSYKLGPFYLQEANALLLNLQGRILRSIDW
jgi:uncharacterized pyridoxamine 5'-phosphate oxidase family protein